MTAGARSGIGQAWQRVVGMATRFFPPRRHSSAGSPAWMQVVERRLEQAAEESRRGLPGCCISPGFDGDCNHLMGCHSRYAGMYLINHWIPAFAGMTERLRSGIGQAWQRGCRDGNPLFPCSPSFRQRPACMDARLQGCTPAWMQVVERRREQAAEVVEPHQEQAAEVPIPLLWRGARQGGVVGRQEASDRGIQYFIQATPATREWRQRGGMRSIWHRQQ